MPGFKDLLLAASGCFWLFLARSFVRNFARNSARDFARNFARMFARNFVRIFARNLGRNFAGKFAFPNDENAHDEAWPVSQGNSASMGCFLALALEKYHITKHSARVFPISENLSVKAQ